MNSSELSDMVFLDGGGGIRQVGPQVSTDHLELDRFHELTQQSRSGGAGRRDRQQVVHQKIGRLFGELSAYSRRRKFDRLQGRLSRELFQSEVRSHPMPEWGSERQQSGQIIVPDRHNEAHPCVPVTGFLDLNEELFSVLPSLRVVGEELLELVDYHDPKIWGVGFESLRDVQGFLQRPEVQNGFSRKQALNYVADEHVVGVPDRNYNGATNPGGRE